MGMFDDLIPQKAGGMFADLIPQQQGRPIIAATAEDYAAQAQPQKPQLGEPSISDYLRTNPVIGAPSQTLLRAGQGIEQLGAHGLGMIPGMGGIPKAVDESINRQNQGYEEAKQRVLGAAPDPRLTNAFIGTGETMGNLINPAGMAGSAVPAIRAAGPVANAAIRGAVSGAGYGASQPVLGDQSNFALQKAGQVVSGTALGGGTGALAERLGAAPRAVPPTTKELKSAATDAYKRAEAEGVVINQSSVRNAVDDITKAAEKQGIDPTLHPKTTAVLSRFKSEAETGDLTFEKAETLRRIANSALDSPDKSERNLAHLVIDKWDDYIGGLAPKDLAADASGVGSRTAAPATALAGPKAKSETLFDAVRRLGGIRINDKAGYITREGGEVRAALKDARTSGVINNQSGLTPDYMREALQQDGWFGRTATSGQDIDEFYQALRTGRDYYHPEDMAGGRKTMMGAWAENEANLDKVRARANQSGVRYEKNWTADDIQAAIDERAAMAEETGAAPARGATAAIESLKEARGLYARSAKSATVERLIERAKNATGANYTTAGYQTALRQQFRQLANNERAMRRFNKDEQDAILKVVRGGPMENVLRMAGKLAIRGPVSGGVTGGLGYLVGGPAGVATLEGIGEAGKYASTRMGLKNVNLAHELMRAGRLPPAPQTGPSPNVPIGNAATAILSQLLLQPRGQ